MLGFRPGLPLVVVGIVLTLLAFLTTTWFSPQDKNATFSDTHDLFLNTGLAPLAVQYLAWLGWVLLAVTAVLGGGRHVAAAPAALVGRRPWSAWSARS